jgi:hypothetical protein
MAAARQRISTGLVLAGLLQSACSLGGVAVRFEPRQTTKRLAKPTGALAIVPAVQPAASAGDAAVAELRELALFSRDSREAGAAAVCLSCGAAPFDEAHFLAALACVAAEQGSAAGAFPGPCPLLVRGWPLSAEQLRAFKGNGMDGLVLPAAAAAHAPEAAAAAAAAGLALVAEHDGMPAPSDAAADADGGSALVRISALELTAGEIGLAQTAHAAGVRAVLLDYASELLPEGDCDQYLSHILKRVERTALEVHARAQAALGTPLVLAS